VLVLGSTGLLGQAVVAEVQSRGWPHRGAARSGTDYSVDITDWVALQALIEEVSPSVIVNCAAITSAAACEEKPGVAYAVNARAPALLAELSAELDSVLVHVSSDHFFTGDGSALHDENASVRLLNEYARAKYAGEMFALTNPRSLVARTNIVGLRDWPGRPTFAEWALNALEDVRPIPLYEDFFTSSMHSRACAKALLDLLQAGVKGLVNVASSQVASKRTFVEALGHAVGVTPRTTSGSVHELVPRRAESLGLDVSRAERLLGRRLPDLQNTVDAIVDEYRSRTSQ
jgi:dTDP-4-dehydrorhamnose reductase